MIFRDCCTQVSPLPSPIHVSELDDIWHMSSSLNIGNVVTFGTTDFSLPTDLPSGLSISG
jgi:hypothetical protein